MSTDDEPVGYKRPPKRTQFRPGNPGGPGRPKGQTNLAAVFRKMFKARVPVVENGKRVTKSMSDAIAKRGQQHILTGPPSAYFKALDLYEKYGPAIEQPRERNANLEGLPMEFLRIFRCMLTRVYSNEEDTDPQNSFGVPKDEQEAVSGIWEVSFNAEGQIQFRRVKNA